MRWDAEIYHSNASFNWDSNINPILEKLDLKSDERCLDLGCGHGGMAAQAIVPILSTKNYSVVRGETLELTLAALAPKCRQVIGIDASPEMIASAQAKLEQNPPLARQEVEFHKVDGHDLVSTSFLHNEPFDCVFSNAALHWMKRDPSAVVKGVASVLKDGGRFVAECGGYLNTAGIRAELHRILKSRGLPFNDPWYFPTPNEYQSLLEQNGFKVTYIELVPRQTLLPNGLMGWLETFVSESFLGCVESIQERQSVLQEACDNLAVDFRQPDGQWSCLYSRLRFVAVKQ